MSKEIGGYFELETYGADFFHPKAILLNSARNALRYIIRAYRIKTLNVPYFTCPVIWDSIKSENCNIAFYDIDENFMPLKDFDNSEYILVNDYFGICGRNICELSSKYTNIIVDNAQSFFSKPYGLASFYSPRKFFGLPDGGLLLCKKQLDEQFEQDVSYGRMTHLLKRYDLGATAGFEDFQKNDNSLKQEPIKYMSALTFALMGNINYAKASDRRKNNFDYLGSELGAINELKIDENTDPPMVYPLLVKNEHLRKKLIDNKIYIARYWDGIERVAPPDSCAVYLKDYLLPLPIDQRYTIEEMKHIVDIVKTEAI